MNKQETFLKLKELWASFDENHNKTTKKSQSVARKILGEFKKLVTQYRKCSVEEAKTVKEQPQQATI